jgi:hypothetical protein
LLASSIQDCKMLICFLQVVERSVEGRHSRIGAIFKAAPHAGTAYISQTLRAPEMESAMMADPNVA